MPSPASNDFKDILEDRKFDRIWMVGAPGVGKSHTTRWLAQHTMAMTIHVGDMLRAKYGEDHFIKHAESSLVPEDKDAEVKEIIESAIESALAQDTLLIIDSLKHPRQVENIPTVDRDLVLIINTDPKILRNRIMKESASRKKLWAAATKEWSTIRANLIEVFEEKGIPIRYIENNNEK